jgi:hypothetical protein
MVAVPLDAGDTPVGLPRPPPQLPPDEPPLPPVEPEQQADCAAIAYQNQAVHERHGSGDGPGGKGHGGADLERDGSRVVTDGLPHVAQAGCGRARRKGEAGSAQQPHRAQ